MLGVRVIKLVHNQIVPIISKECDVLDEARECENKGAWDNIQKVHGTLYKNGEKLDDTCDNDLKKQNVC